MKLHLFFLFLAAASFGGAEARARVHPHVTRLLSLGGGTGTTNVMVSLTNSTDTILAPFLAVAEKFTNDNRGDLLNAVASALEAHATLTQAPILAALAPFAATGLDIAPYWISNQIFLRNVNSFVVSMLQRLPGVSRIEPEIFIPLTSARPTLEFEMRQAAVANTWGVNKVRAPDVWNFGYTGQGVVVGGIDTGVRGSHSSISSRFAGSHGWYDPVARTPTPNDANGHGTHTIATAVGSGGIGVAPGATWMACKGCSSTSCSSNTLTACGQWMLCPTRPDGTGKDCSKAPHITSNSWGGGQGTTFYNSIVNAWRAAGIIPVFSIGNSGPTCGSANSPGDQPNLISVGATDATDTLASYSSVGPSKQGRVKPDIAAPGSNTISASHTSDTGFSTKSGTSMAAPHISGVIALMKSKNPSLQYADVWKHITETAQRTGLRALGRNCGGKSDTSAWPNNSFGYGLVNALNAINAF